MIAGSASFTAAIRSAEKVAIPQRRGRCDETYAIRIILKCPQRIGNDEVAVANVSSWHAMPSNFLSTAFTARREKSQPPSGFGGVEDRKIRRSEDPKIHTQST